MPPFGETPLGETLLGETLLGETRETLLVISGQGLARDDPNPDQGLVRDEERGG